jgi:hypothetical protein
MNKDILVCQSRMCMKHRSVKRTRHILGDSVFFTVAEDIQQTWVKG